jgi:hypothetical protein
MAKMQKQTRAEMKPFQGAFYETGNKPPGRFRKNCKK